MQKYSVGRSDLHEPIEVCKDSCSSVYLASDVDARIAELEKALLGCVEGWRKGEDIAGPMERAVVALSHSLMDRS